MTSPESHVAPTSPSPAPPSPSLNPPPRAHQHPNSPPIRYFSAAEDLATRPASPQPGNGAFGMRRNASRGSDQAGAGAGLGVSGLDMGASDPVGRILIAGPAFGTTADPLSAPSASHPPSPSSPRLSPALHVSQSHATSRSIPESYSTNGRMSLTPNLLHPRAHSPRSPSTASFASSNNGGPAITRIPSPISPTLHRPDEPVASAPVPRRQSSSDLLSLSPPMEPLTEVDVLRDLATGGTIARMRSRNWTNDASGDSSWSGTTATGEQASVVAKPSTEPLLVRTSDTRPPSTASHSRPASDSAASGYPPPSRSSRRQSADSPLAFYTSFLVAIFLPVLFIVFNAVWLWHTNEGGPRWGKALLVFVAVGAVAVWVLMLVTALSNPGIVPRNLDPNPPRHWIPLDPSVSLNNVKEGEGEGEWRVEMQYVEVLGGKAVVGCKWCETCKTYRPPRTSHCRLCDNCVERTDHHCAFLNTCIGRRNYLAFFLFLISTTLLASLSIALSTIHVALGGPRWDWQRIGALVVLALTAVVSAPVGCLAIYHVGLACAQRTTIEMLRPPLIRFALLDPSTHLPFSTTPSTEGVAATTNPWTTGNPVRNCVEVVCFPVKEQARVEAMAERHRGTRGREASGRA